MWYEYMRKGSQKKKFGGGLDKKEKKEEDNCGNRNQG